MPRQSCFQPTPVPRPRRRDHVTRIKLREGRDANDVVVQNVSVTGFSAVAVGRPPARGEAVCALLPDGGEVWGIVRWVEGDAFGVELESPSAS
jgi:hypothetical protein